MFTFGPTDFDSYVNKNPKSYPEERGREFTNSKKVIIDTKNQSKQQN